MLGIWDEEEWRQNSRISCDTFMNLCTELSLVLQLQDIGIWHSLSIKRGIALIWKLVNTDSLYSLTSQIGMEQTMVMTAVHKMCDTILEELGPQFIQHRTLMRSSLSSKIWASRTAQGPWPTSIFWDPFTMPQFISIIRGSFQLYSRKSCTTVGCFTNISAGCSGSVHNVIRNYFHGNDGEWRSGTPTMDLGSLTIPPLIKDLACLLLPWLMKPYISQLDLRKGATVSRCLIVKGAWRHNGGPWGLPWTLAEKCSQLLACSTIYMRRAGKPSRKPCQLWTDPHWGKPQALWMAPGLNLHCQSTVLKRTTSRLFWSKRPWLSETIFYQVGGGLGALWLWTLYLLWCTLICFSKTLVNIFQANLEFAGSNPARYVLMLLVTSCAKTSCRLMEKIANYDGFLGKVCMTPYVGEGLEAFLHLCYSFVALPDLIAVKLINDHVLN